MLDYVVIGGAQAGLAMAYHLKKMKKKFVVVDGEKEIGASWLNRWDSLKLFTPSEFNSLPGMEFPHKKGYYANKYEVAAYLKSYVSKFKIPIKFNHKITSLKKEKGVFTLKSETQE